MLGHDLRVSWRSLFKNSFSSLTLVLMIGGAAGTTASISTIAYTILFRPLPVKDLDRIYHLGGLATPPQGNPLDWWRQAPALEAIATYESGSANFSAETNQARVMVSLVSSSFFGLFAIPPGYGRLFSENDSSNPRVAVLSRRFWESRLAANPDVVGSVVRLNGEPYLVTGIASAGFEFPSKTEVWVLRQYPTTVLNLAADATTGVPPTSSSGYIGRLRPGATPHQAREQLLELLRRLHELYTAKAGLRFGDIVGVLPIRDAISGSSRSALLAALAAAVCVLLLTAANVSSILSARAVGKQREIAIRLGLGASRGMLYRQWLVDAFILASISAIAAIAVGWSLTAALRSMLTSYLPITGIHAPFILMSTALSLTLTLCLIAACASAVQLIIGAQPIAALNQNRDTFSTTRGALFRKTSVVIQIALVFLLSMGTGVAVANFRRLSKMNAGFNPTGIMAAHLSFPKPQFDQSRFLEAQDEILAVSRSTNGVIVAGITNRLPLMGNSRYIFMLPDKTAGEQRPVSSEYSLVGGDYFQVMRIPFKFGGPFEQSDQWPLVINEAAARALWLGGKVRDELQLEGEDKPRKVVGIIADIRSGALSEDPKPQAYLPFTHPYRNKINDQSLSLVLRCSVDCTQVVPVLRSSLTRSGVGVPLYRVETMDEIVSASIFPLKIAAVLLGAYAGFGIFLAFSGVYALISYLTNARMFEIGVRVAMGASPWAIALLIISETYALAAIGAVLGAAGSIAGAKFIASSIYGIETVNAGLLATIASALITGAILAAAIPSIRAARIDPVCALRR